MGVRVPSVVWRCHADPMDQYKASSRSHVGIFLAQLCDPGCHLYQLQSMHLGGQLAICSDNDQLSQVSQLAIGYCYNMATKCNILPQEVFLSASALYQ